LQASGDFIFSEGLNVVKKTAKKKTRKATVKTHYKSFPKKRGPKGKDKYRPEFVLKVLQSYIKKTRIPIFVEVCYKNEWVREYVYQLGEKNEEISYAIKLLSQKKEANLERDGLKGKINKTMAVFSLKQLGWKDRQLIEHSGSVESRVRNMTEEERLKRKEELKKKLAEK
jgi:hypothetical protein